LYDNYYRNETATRFNFGLEHIVRLFRLWRAFKVRSIDRNATRILDVGCGRGWMLYYLKKYFRFGTVAGTQISRPAVNFARTRLGLTVYDRDLLDLQLPNESLDIITIWHVLEHLPNPQSCVAEMHRLLKTGGVLVVEVPNLDSWSRPLTGEYWLSWDPQYHLTMFSPASLSRLLTSAGFSLRTVHTFSLEYSTFTSVQSIVSRLTRTNQRFFGWLQCPQWSPSIIADIALFGLLIPPCLLVNLMLYFTRRGEVLLIVAQK
jgi:ubiquinone/menaquinone biosynthesis C-methylase UbiE